MRFTLTSTLGLEGTGVWFQGHEPTGVLTIEGQFDAASGSGTVNFSLSDPSGHDAADVAPTVEFGGALAHPNRIQVAGKYGSFEDLQDGLAGEPLIAPFTTRYISALATLQAHTFKPIKIPDLKAEAGDDAESVIHAAKLLSGQTIVGTWSQMEISGVGALDGHYQLEVIRPLTVTIGGDRLTFGAVQHELQSAGVTDLGDGRLRAVPNLNDTVHLRHAPNESVPPEDQVPVRSRPAPPAPAG
ncbi:hypothetical protein [Isoptericola croceus]|uniref:hypothetical protein n=1 Tax=Isoptericola croceus TaxID=3031406 RepID=UPI0023F9B868|nr:hypothetical protein [Isoptericola croceus]